MGQGLIRVLEGAGLLLIFTVIVRFIQGQRALNTLKVQVKINEANNAIKVDESNIANLDAERARLRGPINPGDSSK